MSLIEDIITGGTVKDDFDLDSLSGFKNGVCMIDCGDGKYACNNATTPGPDPMTVDGIACFPDEEEATVYMATPKYGLRGTVVRKTLEEARAIAVSKPAIQALLFMEGSKVKEIMYVR